jgi:hypothetical protein
MLATKPDRLWYAGRAVAESVKSLAWRYAVAGEPFRIDTVPPRQAAASFLARVKDLATEPLELPVVSSRGPRQQITRSMERLRGLSLEERKRAYQEGRVRDQRAWYTTKAAWNDGRANLWTGLTLAFEAVGGVAAVALVLQPQLLDLPAIAATVVAAATAWVQTKQHRMLAAAYALASRELEEIDYLIDDQTTEEQWAHFVEQAEGGIPREHTMWRASRSGSVGSISSRGP